MRILQLVQKPQRRGAEIFAFELSQWLRDQGDRVATGYLYPFDGEASLPLHADDRVLGGNERALSERIPGVSPALFARLYRWVREFRPDIIQLNGARSIKYGAALKRSRLGHPCAFVYRNIDSPVFWVRGAVRVFLYKRVFMPCVDGVVGVSQTTLEEVRSFYELRVPHLFIPNGVDFSKLDSPRPAKEIRRELAIEDSELYVLFFGKLTAQKRPDRFLRTIASLRRGGRSVVGVLLGDGPDRAALEAQANDLGIAEFVRFVGHQSDVASYVAAADLYILSSDTEGIPAVILEVAYLGVPIVAMDVGGVSECIDESTGCLVPAGDEDALAKGASALLSAPDKAASLAAAAREQTVRDYSMPTVGARYREFYEKVRGTS